MTKDQLLSQADKDLADRTRWAPFLYLLVYTIILIFTPFYTDHHTEIIILGIAIFIAALMRTLLVMQFDKWYAVNASKWRLAFFVTSFLLAGSWGLLCLLAVTHYQLEWTAMLVLLITAGIAAVVVSTLSIYSILSISYLFLLLAPSIVATSYLYTKESIAVMLMFLLYGGFMVIVSKRLNREYWRALENTMLLDKRARQLADSNKELESYSYSIAHDLRAPLRTITAFSQILLEDADDRLNIPEKEHLGRIVNAGRHMAQLIDDILELSRITRIDVKYSDVNLSQLAEECLQGLTSSDPRRAIDINVQPNIYAKGDARLLRIVLNNLLSNAWKFTSYSSNPQIKVGEIKNGGQRVFYVKDNGVGFDMKYADKIFGIFHRLHTREEFEGTGIGLASVERIIHRHGGKVWVDASANKGATFYFTVDDDISAVNG